MEIERERRKAKKTKIDGERQYSSWCNLADDIIRSIMNRLCYVDQIRFRAVCKGWREVEIAGLVKPADKLPWNMAMDSRSCYLYYPCHKQKYTIKNSITKSGIFVNSWVLASKHGWVLFARRMKEYFVDEEAAIFLYSPFTNKIIQLPNLEMSCLEIGTFTASPLSPDCEIFVAVSSDVLLRVYMCKAGDTRWTELYKSRHLDEISYDGVDDDDHDDDDDHNDDDYKSMVVDHIEYVDGTLYCSFQETYVTAFNVARKEWRIFSCPLHSFTDYMFESDGDLLLCDDGNSFPCGSGIYQVFKLDRSLGVMNWIRIENIGNTSLFLDSYSSLLIPAEDETSELAGTIHSARCRRRTSRCPKISKIYDWDGKNLKNIWIQPPQWR